MDEYNQPNSDVFIFLLTTRAGVSCPSSKLSPVSNFFQGVGINLYVCLIGCGHYES